MASSLLGFALTCQGDKDVALDLRSMAKRGDDPRPFFRATMEELRHREPEWFSSHGGGDWPELAEATLAEKRASGWTLEPLIASNLLRHSLTERTGAQAIRSVTKKGMHFGTRVWYARVHQRSFRDTLPRRDPIVKLDHRKRRKMVDELTLYLLGKHQPGMRSW